MLSPSRLPGLVRALSGAGRGSGYQAIAYEITPWLDNALSNSRTGPQAAAGGSVALMPPARALARCGTDEAAPAPGRMTGSGVHRPAGNNRTSARRQIRRPRAARDRKPRHEGARVQPGRTNFNV